MALKTHACPGGCGAEVARARFACLKDWRRLPADLRRAITGNYGVDADAHMVAMVEARAWFRAHPA